MFYNCNEVNFYSCNGGIFTVIFDKISICKFKVVIKHVNKCSQMFLTPPLLLLVGNLTVKVQKKEGRETKKLQCTNQNVKSNTS